MELRYNDAHTTSSITTHTALIGFGYQFERSCAAGPVWNTQRYGFYPSGQRFEVAVMSGSTVVNNFNSPRGVAWGAELRYRVTPYIDAIGTYLDEGDARVVKRKGVAGQLGIKREFLSHRATQVLGLLTMSATYRIEAGLRVRAYW